MLSYLYLKGLYSHLTFSAKCKMWICNTCWIAPSLILILNSLCKIKSYFLSFQFFFFAFNIISQISYSTVLRLTLHKFLHFLSKQCITSGLIVFAQRFFPIWSSIIFPRSTSGEHTNPRYVSIGTFVDAKNAKKFNPHFANHWSLDFNRTEKCVQSIIFPC